MKLIVQNASGTQATVNRHTVISPIGKGSHDLKIQERQHDTGRLLNPMSAGAPTEGMDTIPPHTREWGGGVLLVLLACLL